MHHNFLQTWKSKAICQLRRVSSCNPALESKLLKAETPDLAPDKALMLFKKASSQHLPVQRGQCFRISDSCQAWSLARAPTQSFTVEPEATLVSQLGSAESKSCDDKTSSACLCDATSTRQLLQPPTVTPAPVDRITAAANQVADLPKARTQQSPQQREEAKLCLLSKQVFWSYHMPALVARRKPVKSRSGGCLERSGDRQFTICHRFETSFFFAFKPPQPANRSKQGRPGGTTIIKPEPCYKVGWTYVAMLPA